MRRTPPRRSLDLRHLIRDAGLTFWLNVCARGAYFITAVLLARLLGVDGFGAFSYAMGWVGLLSVLGGLGFGELLVREVAALSATRRWGRLRGLITWARTVSLRVSAALVALSVVATWLVRDRVAPEMLAVLWISVPLVPILVLVRIDQATVRGRMRLLRGQLAEGMVLPVSFILLLGLMALGVVSAEPEHAMGLQVAAGVGALVYATVAMRRSLPAETREASVELETSAWWNASLALFFITATRVVNSRADILLLGAFEGAEAVGLYNAAARGAELTTLPIIVAGVILAPRFASLHARGATDELWRLFWIATAGMALTSAPVAAGLIVFNEQALSLFGPSFPRAGTAMTILALGQWFVAATGPTSHLLIMTGNERATGAVVVAGTTLNIVLNVVLIPVWGVEGAAVATGVSMTALNLGLLAYAALRLRPRSDVGGAAP